MAFNISDSGGDYEPIPAGFHHAICILVADIGTHKNLRYNTKYRKVAISWELPTVRVELSGDSKTTAARIISQVYTASLNSKARLFAMLTSWRGVKFTEQELKQFDILSIAEKNCQLNVVHEIKDGKTYANIAAVVALPKAQWLTHEHPIITFSLEEHGSIPENMPDWLKEKIQSSEEMSLGQPSQESPPQEPGEPVMTGVPEDELPF